MITVTDGAKEELKKTLLAQTDDPENGLRLVVQPPGQFGLVLDKEGYGDQIVEHDGAKVLLVGNEVAELLQEVTLDVQYTPDGTRLVISKE